MSIFVPRWETPPGVKTVISHRLGGVSSPPFDSFNVASHVEDDPAAVEQNRQTLGTQIEERFSVGPDIQWLNQVHKTQVRVLTPQNTKSDKIPEADGAYTSSRNIACAVLTADCLPVLMCNKQGTEVAAVHAGWRGLAAGILTEALLRFRSPPEHVQCYLGPAISQSAFQVGKDVHDAFCEAATSRTYAEHPSSAFVSEPNVSGKLYADIYRLARSELRGAGVRDISGGDYCTFSERERFYSFRRDGSTGRMASLIWIS